MSDLHEKGLLSIQFEKFVTELGSKDEVEGCSGFLHLCLKAGFLLFQRFVGWLRLLPAGVGLLLAIGRSLFRNLGQSGIGLRVRGIGCGPLSLGRTSGIAVGFLSSAKRGQGSEPGGFPDLLRSDVVGGIIAHLLLASAVGFIDGLLHALGDGLGIHDDATVDVTRCTTGSLSE